MQLSLNLDAALMNSTFIMLSLCGVTVYWTDYLRACSPTTPSHYNTIIHILFAHACNIRTSVIEVGVTRVPGDSHILFSQLAKSSQTLKLTSSVDRANFLLRSRQKFNSRMARRREKKLAA